MNHDTSSSVFKSVKLVRGQALDRYAIVNFELLTSFEMDSFVIS
jgi:hypothetical protein